MQSLYLLSVKTQFDSSNSSLIESIHIPEIHERYFIVCVVNDLIYKYIHITLKKIKSLSSSIFLLLVLLNGEILTFFI